MLYPRRKSLENIKHFAALKHYVMSAILRLAVKAYSFISHMLILLSQFDDKPEPC